MGRDRSYDRGRAWRAGDEEEGGYEHGMLGDDSVLHRPRYGREPGRPSNGGVDYPSMPGRDRVFARDAEDAGGPHAGKGPRGYRRSDDRIVEDVNENLTANPFLDASEIEVSVRDGQVTLEGTVESRSQKRLAEDIAEAVRGVLDVHNRLTIDVGGGVRPDPDPIDPPTM